MGTNSVKCDDIGDHVSSLRLLIDDYKQTIIRCHLNNLDSPHVRLLDILTEIADILDIHNNTEVAAPAMKKTHRVVGENFDKIVAALSVSDHVVIHLESVNEGRNSRDDSQYVAVIVHEKDTITIFDSETDDMWYVQILVENEWIDEEFQTLDGALDYTLGKIYKILIDKIIEESGATYLWYLINDTKQFCSSGM